MTIARRGPKDYTVKELADLAGVTPARIRQVLGECNSSLRRGSVKRGGAWFIPAQTAKRWLESRNQ